MCALQQIDREQVGEFLKHWAPARMKDLDELFNRLHPVFKLDTEKQEIVFNTCPSTKTITLGLKASCRLQAHAYTAAIIFTGMGTPDKLGLAREDRERFYAPADRLLTWAVRRDLQQPLNKIEHRERSLEDVMAGAGAELPNGLLGNLSQQQRVLGEGFFRLSVAFIILHELAHLGLNHTDCEGRLSIEQEREADRYAAKWLLQDADTRRQCLLAIAIALLWLTVFNVYLGPSRSDTHPESCERLFDLLAEFIDENSEAERIVWNFVVRSLLVHMYNAEIVVETEPMQASPREQVEYLVRLLTHRRP